MHSPLAETASFVAKTISWSCPNMSHKKEIDSVISRQLTLSSMAAGSKHKYSRLAIYQALRSNPGDPKNWIALGLFERTQNHPYTPYRLEKIGQASTSISHDDATHDLMIWSKLIQVESNFLQKTDLIDIKNNVSELDQLLLHAIGDLAKQVIYTVLGKLSFLMGDINLAISLLKQAVIFVSNQWQLPWDQLAFLYEKSNRYIASKLCLEKSIQTYDMESHSLVVPLTRLAKLQLCLGQSDEALNTINEALKIHSNCHVIRFIQANLLRSKGNVNRVSKILNPLYDMNDFKDALSWFDNIHSCKT